MGFGFWGLHGWGFTSAGFKKYGLDWICDGEAFGSKFRVEDWLFSQRMALLAGFAVPAFVEAGTFNFMISVSECLRAGGF